MGYAVHSLSQRIGAEVLGVDLSRGMDCALAERLNRALLEHIVLVIRDQHLDPERYVAAMRSLGVPARQNHAKQLMPGFPEIWVIDSRQAEVSATGERMLFGANSWHTDHTNLDRPPKVTALLAVQLPPSGGDTSFVNAYAAYQRLSSATRRRIDSLRVIYGADRHLQQREEDRDAFARAVAHPLVRTHPETGRRALYCHPLKAQSIDGMAPERSFELIDRVLTEALAADITYRHVWKHGDLVLIDNRACLHRAHKNYDPDSGRVMHRVIVEGDVPV